MYSDRPPVPRAHEIMPNISHMASGQWRHLASRSRCYRPGSGISYIAGYRIKPVRLGDTQKTSSILLLRQF
jgi:hypothetical protein